MRKPSLVSYMKCQGLRRSARKDTPVCRGTEGPGCFCHIVERHVDGAVDITAAVGHLVLRDRRTTRVVVGVEVDELRAEGRRDDEVVTGCVVEPFPRSL